MWRVLSVRERILVVLLVIAYVLQIISIFSGNLVGGLLTGLANGGGTGLLVWSLHQERGKGL